MKRRNFLKAGWVTGTVLLNSKPGNAFSLLKPEKKLRVALCGLGRYAGYLADGIAESKYCELAGIITGTPAKKVSWQLRFPSGAIAESKTSYSENEDRVYAKAKNGFFELSPAISYGPFKGRSSAGPFQFPETNQQAVQMDAIYKAASTGEKIVLSRT
ncbi:MAG TPA: hypothetical protein PLQ32_01695 [Flavihumibacter sp.]|nr:hypothetical protein [Bacteroidota bacterium]HPZ86785.1 hypothetical protein [Flavihumibacter sp.]